MSEKQGQTRRDFLARSGAVILGSALSGNAGFAASVRSALDPANNGAGKAPIIDCHAHVGIAEDLVDPWDTFADPTLLLSHAEEAGVDKTVIFPINNKSYIKPNEYIVQTCQKYPGKFIGFARHSAATEHYPIRPMLFHEIHDLGLRGLKLHDQPSQEILDAVRDLQIPVLAHLAKVPDFEEFLPYYPTVNFIVAHLGGEMSADVQEHLDAIDLAKRYPNVYLDSSIVLLTEYLEMAIKQLGPEKVLLASDGPDGDVRMDIFKIRVLGLPKEHEEKILGGNILRLLGGRS
jgi:predicted TIM-barrel fold metal-dependent hydrolase